VAEGFEDAAKRAIEHRLARPPAHEARFHGKTSGYSPTAYSLSGLERYQDCPFKYFARDILRLTETPQDEPFLSPRARGRFVHEAFQRFFEAWDAQGTRTITVDDSREARTLFADVVEPMFASLGDSDAALERARLFGSAINVGIIDVVLALEASRPAAVTERWLEAPFNGEFSLGARGAARVPIRGVADRIDLLDGHRLRVIDYKTGAAPDPRRALQVPVYALCAQERLEERDGRSWTVAEAAYVSFAGRRALVPVVTAGEDSGPSLRAARERLLAIVEGVSSGEFSPRPHTVTLCRSCAYPSVCRRDYAERQS
jgi:ATP-dependent helicase/nuclease subunit B